AELVWNSNFSETWLTHSISGTPHTTRMLPLATDSSGSTTMTLEAAWEPETYLFELYGGEELADSRLVDSESVEVFPIQTRSCSLQIVSGAKDAGNWEVWSNEGPTIRIDYATHGYENVAIQRNGVDLRTGTWGESRVL